MEEKKKKPPIYGPDSLIGDLESKADPYLNELDKFLAEKLRRDPEVKRGVPGGEDPILDKTKPPYDALPSKDFKPEIGPDKYSAEAQDKQFKAAMAPIMERQRANKQAATKAMDEFADVPAVQSPELPEGLEESRKIKLLNEIKRGMR